MTQGQAGPPTQRPIFGTYVDAQGNQNPCIIVKIYANQSADLYEFDQAGAGVTWQPAVPFEPLDNGIVSSWFSSDI